MNQIHIKPDRTTAVHRTHFDRQKIEDFNFLRGLAPGLLDGFSIETYEKKRESLALSATWFESGGMSFSGRTRPGAGAVQKIDSPLSIY